MKKIVLTAHAIQRYQERVKPAMDAKSAEREMHTLCTQVTFTGKRPWPIKCEREDKIFAEVTPGICFIAFRDTRGKIVVTTVLDRHDLHPAVRAERKRLRRLRRAARRKPREMPVLPHLREAA